MMALERPSVHEEQARAAKALAIASLLREHGGTAHVAVLLSPEARKAAASLADQREPSDQTWAVVVEMLRGMERVDTDSPFVRGQERDAWEGLR